MNESAADFLAKNWFHLGSLLAVIILCFYRLKDLGTRVGSLEVHGPQPIREQLQLLSQKSAYAESRLAAIEIDQKQTNAVISEFRSDLRLVVEWVKDQKRKDDHSHD